MFGFLKRNALSDPSEFLRLISEKSAPNFFWSDDTRKENRNNRTIPVTISPWEKNKPCDSPMQVALTKDVSTYGVCLITPIEITNNEIVVGFQIEEFELEEPLFFLGSVRKVSRFATGFWQIGVEITELLNSRFERRIKKMSPTAIELLSPIATDSGPETSVH